MHDSLAAGSEADPDQHTQDILDGIGDAFFGVDRTWRILAFNRACETFFQRPRDEALGGMFWQVCPEAVGTEFESRCRAAMRERSAHEFQAPSPVRAGGWLHVRVFPIRQGLGVAFRDVSGRRRAEEELRYQLERMRAITDHAAEALFLMDEHGRVDFMNPSAERMFGFSGEELMGSVLHDMIHHRHPDGRPYPMSACPLGAVFRAGVGVKVHEDVFFRKDGTAVPVSCSNTPVVKDGRVVGAALVVRDVTEQNRREAALRESEARFRHMADSAPALIWMTDAQGRITFANMHFDYMFGRPAASMRGRGWTEIVLPDDLPAFDAAFAEAFGNRHPFRAEVRVRDKDGCVRWLRCEGVPRLDDAGTFLGYTGCNVDITDVKAADERQRLLINELNHRVKNTLATVQSIASQTLRNVRSPGQAREDLEMRLMALSRAHDVLTRENWEGAHLKPIVEGALDPYRHRGESRLRVKGPELRLPPRMALALAMALQELATNAAKYGALSNGAGKVDVTWAVLAAESPRLILRWKETDGPPVQPPTRRGFGSKLIERSLALDLGGDVTIDFAPQGVICTVDAPLEQREA